MKGYFLCIEGGDGSGKSTQIQNIKTYLTERGQQVVVTREPGGTPIAESIRNLLLDPANAAMTPKTEMLLYAAARAQHIEEKIVPALTAGNTVLTDRFVTSSIAYQGYGRGLGEVVAEVNRIATDGLVPDLTIFLDLSPAAGIARKQKQENHTPDRLETEQTTFHEAVYQGYCSLVQKGQMVAIDAARSPEEVFRDIKKELNRLFSFSATEEERQK